MTTFPAGFAWGTATASYQIEGAATEDRGPSIWDEFCRRPGAILNGDTGDVACDHYHRVESDADLLRWLGAPYYRFSIAWPRLQPDGTGPLRTPGVDFYSRLVDALLARDIVPWVTLYHWDLPQELEAAGGWPARDTAYRFADYAAAVHARLADRIVHWTTLNEPFCSAFLGYADGSHAPGIADPRAAVAAAHHLMLGHGEAVTRMRAAGAGSRLGITLNLAPMRPATDAAADLDAARRIDGRRNRFFLDALFRGGYPADIVAEYDRFGFAEVNRAGDAAVIAAPLDLLGVNFYRPFVVRGRTTAEEHRPGPYVGCADVQHVPQGLPTTAMGWEIDPSGLHELLVRLARDYPTPPMYITENGAAFPDEPTADGRVPDPDRVSYLDRHLRAAHRAIADGVDLRGFFAWSLLDNFEWALGYDRRFGLIHVDYPTQRRTPKDSAHWYREVVRANALPPTPSGDPDGERPALTPA